MQDKEINPNGFIKLCELFMQELITRKKIALFDDYNVAKNDVLMELKNKSRDDDEYCNAIDHIIAVFEKTTYVEEWFNEM